VRYSGCRYGAGQRSGIVAAEFMVTAPLLCLFLFGIIDLGLAFSTQMRLISIAQESARAAAAGESEYRIQQRVAEIASRLDTEHLQLTIEYAMYLGQGQWASTWQTMQSVGDFNTIPLNSHVRVTVVYDYHVLAPGLLSFLLDDPVEGTKRLAARVSMPRT